MRIGTGACIGFFAGLIDFNVTELYLGGATYGFYVFAHHWLIHSIIDELPAPVLEEQ